VQRSLAPAVQAADGVALQAVAARSLERAAALEPVGRSYDDYHALLADPTVDLVYIALDNGGHLPWTLAALEAGKHVLCEKPLGLDPGALEMMISAAARNDRLLVEAFWYRWHPRTRRLEQLLAEGALGPLRSIDTGFSFSGPDDGDPDQQYRMNPERGGGALYDVGCYALSAAHLALGPSLRVTSARARRGPSGVDLEASARLLVTAASPTTEPGASALIHCGIAAADRQVLKVTGQAGTIEFGDPAFTALPEVAELIITSSDGTVHREQFGPVDAYRLMVEAVAARIRGGESFLPGPEHSRQVAATTAAIFAAL
jgi:predicted dehydrogenase